MKFWKPWFTKGISDDHYNLKITEVLVKLPSRSIFFFQIGRHCDTGYLTFYNISLCTVAGAPRPRGEASSPGSPLAPLRTCALAPCGWGLLFFLGADLLV